MFFKQSGYTWLVVGLGNPGARFESTRHNMGFMALDILAARHNIDIRKENFRSVYGEGRIGTERVILAKPLTFMNNSGWAVRDLVNWFKIEHDQLIVIYDDIDLDPGDLRIREKGSSGSHNGMKSVIYQLGFDDFPRIRVGVGAPEGGRDLIAHVMSMPTGEALDKVKAALNDASVFIYGETGTGKELLAQSIHHAGKRKDRPFLAQNCAAIPETLLEGILFGTTKGAFTGATSMRKGRFEQADGGTLFLDEVGELSMMTQAKLLRVLQERSFERLGGMETIRVDVRVITATNRNLEKMVAEGTFRRDLFYRLNVFPIVLPPLRDRQDDILPLASHFVGHFARQAGKGDVRISLAAMDMLQRYSWPGNIRELENAMERAVLLVGSQNLILPQHLPPAMHTESVNMADEKQRKMPHMAATLEQRMDELERACIVDAMEATGGQINRAAQQLGLTQRVLALRLKKYGLSYKEYRRGGREQAGK